mgnify:CR=1 FL=1
MKEISHQRIILDNIAKKEYGEKFEYLTHKQKNECVNHYHLLVKLEKEKSDAKAHVLKSLQMALAFLIVMSIIVMLNHCN